MNEQRPSMLTPALLGGAVAGILSGLPFLNCLCCFWIIGGAMLAAYLLAKESPVSLTAGDGAVVGALAGLSAAVVDSLISLPLRGPQPGRDAPDDRPPLRIRRRDAFGLGELDRQERRGLLASPCSSSGSSCPR